MIEAKQSKKSETMIRRLEQDILSGRLNCGDRIPSIRELMELFSISKGTVERGISELCRRGFLEKRPGSGTFVANSRLSADTQKSGAVTVFCPSYGSLDGKEASMFANILRGILEIARENDVELNSICCLGKDPLKIKKEQIDYANAFSSGIIFVGDYDTANTDLDLRVPSVGTFMCSNFGNRTSLVNPDIWDAAEKICAYFLKCGQKHVRIVTCGEPIYLFRSQVFEQVWHNAGNTSEKVVLPHSWSEHCLQQGEAYFFASDSMAQHALWHTFEKTGILFYEKGCICAIDGKRACVPSFYPFSTYAVDWNNIGRFLFEELFFRISHPGCPARRVHVAGEFREYCPEE